MNPSYLNVGLDHLSRIETGEETKNNDEGLLDVNLFRVDVIDGYYDQIIQFLVTGVTLEYFSTSQKKQLVVKISDLQLIAG